MKLLFDTVNKNRDIFPKDCEITIPEKLPLTWQCHHQEVIGMAEVIKDDLGLIAKVEITLNAHIKEEDLKSNIFLLICSFYSSTIFK